MAALIAGGCGEDERSADASNRRIASGTNALTVDEVLPTGQACTPNGAHAKHAFTDCKTCHVCGGVLQFDAAGPAGALATFDATVKTCSNVACHSVPAGTFNYVFPGGDGEPEPKSVSYGGQSSGGVAYWYTSGAPSCTACHGNPPNSYVWHTGNHANQGPTGKYNQCQYCHPDAVSTNAVATGLSTATNCVVNGVPGQPCAKLHANGTLDMAPTFVSACFGCH